MAAFCVQKLVLWLSLELNHIKPKIYGDWKMLSWLNKLEEPLKT